jgi:hypothetical protein
MRKHYLLILAVAITLAVGGGIASFMKMMAPIHAGKPEDFWYIACRVELTGEHRDYLTSGRTAQREGWFIYEMGHLHGSSLFKVKCSEAIIQFPEVIRRLEGKVEKPDPNNYVVAGYIEWKRNGEATASRVEALLEKTDEAFGAWLRARSPEGYAYHKVEDYFFERRLQQAKWYWANLVFEFLFLSGLVWIALWPALRGKEPWRWALHLGLVPLLFMLPAYLGYATYTFTSRGPSGGVLYPWLLIFFRHGSMTQIDQRILERLPQILEPLSQGIGSPLALTGAGMWGPTAVVCLCLVVSVAAFVVVWLAGRQRKTEKSLTS